MSDKIVIRVLQGCHRGIKEKYVSMTTEVHGQREEGGRGVSRLSRLSRVSRVSRNSRVG
jgi:hypothetical protein